MFQFFRRRVASLLMMLFVVGGPLAVLNGKSVDALILSARDGATRLWRQWSPSSAGETAAASGVHPPVAARSSSGLTSSTASAWQGGPPPTTPPHMNFPGAATPPPFNPPPPPLSLGVSTVPWESVLRFDLTPDAVRNRWSRVSTVLSDFPYTALRAPLVTGTTDRDLAGSITYYFDQEQTMQRITLDGLTKDPSGLEQFVLRVYRLEPAQTSRNLYVSRPDFPLSALYVHRRDVVRQGGEREPVRCTLELNRPNGKNRLSNWFATMLMDDGVLPQSPLVQANLAQQAAEVNSPPAATAAAPGGTSSLPAASGPYKPPKEGSPAYQAMQSQQAPAAEASPWWWSSFGGTTTQTNNWMPTK